MPTVVASAPTSTTDNAAWWVLIWSLLFKPAAPGTPMSRLCEAVYPIIGGKELKFAAMNPMQKYASMKAILQVMEVWSAVTHSAYAEGVSHYFKQIAIDYLEIMAVDNETAAAEWAPLLGRLPGFDLDLLGRVVGINYKHLPDSLSDMLITCCRFAKAYDEIFEEWEEHVIEPIKTLKFHMKLAGSLGLWERLYPNFRLRFDASGEKFDEKHAAKVFNEFWAEEYIVKNELFLGDKLQKAYGIRPRSLSDASTVSFASSAEGEDPLPVLLSSSSPFRDIVSPRAEPTLTAVI